MSDQILEPPGSHEPTEHAKTPKKAAASGWIGSALEYYDFFIYAQAAALVFPTIFFPSDNPQVAIVASFATFGVGYVARPIGAFVLGHWGDTHGRKNVLVLCMLMMGGSTFLVALLPTYARGRRLGADPAGGPAADPGLRGRRRDLRRQRDDPRALAVRRRGYFAQLHPAGRAGRPDHRRRRLPAAVRDHVDGGLPVLGLADPVPAQRARGRRRLHHPAQGRRDPGVPGGGRARRGARGADRPGRQGERRGHAPGDLHGADERHSHRGDGVRRHVRHERRLRRRPDHDELPVDLGVRQHRRRRPDPVRRQPDRPHRPAAGDHRRLPGLRHPGLPVPVLRQPGQPRRWRSCSPS